MSSSVKLKKVIKIYWYIIGILGLVFLYNCYQYVEYRYANPEMNSVVNVSGSDNYIRLINFWIRDGKPSFYVYGLSINSNIYTGDNEYISYDNQPFEKDGKLEYYAILENTLYYAHIPPEIDQEIKEALRKRKRMEKMVWRYFTIYPEGQVKLEIKEVGNAGDYYDEDLLLYETTYQAKAYPADPILADLDKAAYIDYSDKLPELLGLKYNWIVRLVCDEKIDDKTIDEIRTRDIATNYWGNKATYGLDPYVNFLKFLPDNIKIGDEYIKFDVKGMTDVFSKVYQDSDFAEQSYILILLSDDLRVQSIYLMKDDVKTALPYTARKTY